MKKKLKATTLFLSGLLLLPSLFALLLVATPRAYSESYYAELTPMYRRLAAAENRKIVIIGGSAVAFGVRADMIETELNQRGIDCTVCNFGLYGAIGIKPMAEFCLSALNENDLVIFLPELNEEVFALKTDASVLVRSLESIPELFFPLDSELQNNIIGKLYSYALERYQRSRETVEPIEGVYSLSSFDDNGVMTYERSGNCMSGGHSGEITLANLDIEVFSAYANEFYKSASKRGAEVYMSFAPAVTSACLDTDTTRDNFYQRLVKALDFPIISDFSSCFMDEGWFYDTNYHLNSAGAVLFSNELCNEILTVLGTTDYVQWEIPEMPVPIQTETMEEEPDNGWFLYDGAEIVALTEEGACQTKLRLPSVHDGEAITTFSADLFSGNTTIERIIIPESVTDIPDYAFSGCTSLAEIRLLQRDPNLIRAGSHLLDGTDAVIVVDEDVYMRYAADSYFWQNYGNMIRTEP